MIKLQKFTKNGHLTKGDEVRGLSFYLSNYDIEDCWNVNIKTRRLNVTYTEKYKAFSGEWFNSDESILEAKSENIIYKQSCAGKIGLSFVYEGRWNMLTFDDDDTVLVCGEERNLKEFLEEYYNNMIKVGF